MPVARITWNNSRWYGLFILFLRSAEMEKIKGNITKHLVADFGTFQLYRPHRSHSSLRPASEGAFGLERNSGSGAGSRLYAGQRAAGSRKGLTPAVGFRQSAVVCKQNMRPVNVG